MKKSALVLIAALTLGVPSIAGAAAMDVTYNVTGNMMLLNALPIAPAITGSVTVRYNATGTAGQVSGSGGTPLHGWANLMSGNLGGAISLNMVALGGPLLTGNFTAGLQRAGATLGSSGNLVLGPAPFGIGGFIHCNNVAGSACTTMLSPSMPASNPIPLSMVLTGVPPLVLVAPGAATTGSNLNPSFAFNPIAMGTIAGYPYTLNLAAQEVSRHLTSDPVPEPTTLLLVGLGLAGVALAGRGVRRSKS
jgi:hypothetical protein